jgi:prepilin-type N-terminal cleavage/methylation domain-containing protein
MKFNKGFTLIELLIVIAILGALAAVALLAINPAEQLARTRDASRQQTVGQLGRALQAYSTAATDSSYVPESATWIQSLVTAGETSTLPSSVPYSLSGTGACTVNAQNGFCYDASNATGGGPVIAFARLESGRNNSRCTTAGQVAWFVYASAQGRAGIVCSTNAPGITGWSFLP